jgi:hypothetical protein
LASPSSVDRPIASLAHCASSPGTAGKVSRASRATPVTAMPVVSRSRSSATARAFLASISRVSNPW